MLLAWQSQADGIAPKVFYGGIAYLGSYEFIEQNYQHARRLNRSQEGHIGQLDGFFKTALDRQPPTQFKLEFGLANLYESESVVMAVAIDKELVSLEKYHINNEVRQKLIVEASAQLLFFDYESKNLIANYPQALAINHLLPVTGIDLDKEIEKLFNTLYLGAEQSVGFLQRIADTAQSASVAQLRGFRFQLRQFNLENQVEAQLPGALSAGQFRQYFGQFFSAQLAQQYPVPVLPFIKGYALGNQLPGRFANGQVFNLQFPEPDFVFDITVKKFAKGKDKSGLIYGAQLSFDFLENDGERVLANDDFRYGVYKIDSGSESEVDDWSAYEDALENLIIELVQQLNKPNRNWLSEHARNGSASYKNFNAKKELFDEYLR